MSNTTIQTLKRQFKMGSTLLDDIAPDLTPEESLKMWSRQYPHLTQCSLGEPEVKDDTLVFPVEKPPVETKG